MESTNLLGLIPFIFHSYRPRAPLYNSFIWSLQVQLPVLILLFLWILFPILSISLISFFFEIFSIQLCAMVGMYVWGRVINIGTRNRKVKDAQCCSAQSHNGALAHERSERQLRGRTEKEENLQSRHHSHQDRTKFLVDSQALSRGRRKNLP